MRQALLGEQHAGLRRLAIGHEDGIPFGVHVEADAGLLEGRADAVHVLAVEPGIEHLERRAVQIDESEEDYRRHAGEQGSADHELPDAEALEARKQLLQTFGRSHSSTCMGNACRPRLSANKLARGLQREEESGKERRAYRRARA